MLRFPSPPFLSWAAHSFPFGTFCVYFSGTGYPCHPYCLAFDEDEMLHEAFLKMADENRAQSPLKQCLRYKRRKLALTLALLSKAAIGTDLSLKFRMKLQHLSGKERVLVVYSSCCTGAVGCANRKRYFLARKDSAADCLHHATA